MSIGDLELLKHIPDEVNFVLNHTAGKQKEEVINDEVLCRAVVRSIEIIGEATKKLHEDFKSQYPHVEWKKISRTRDKLIHHYFGIDYDIVWDIITAKLPELKPNIEEILEDSAEKY
ncbi:MAG TPA: DUF86 domain-containing protein [Flavipsychrobacter sp.]|nr:DUF86 domain-containing protein [Flavipsychrobacter sp.]